MKNVYINLPIRNVAETDRFFAALGCSKNHFFSSEDTTNARLNNTTVLMLLEDARFSAFTGAAHQIPSNGHIIALQYDTPEEVDAFWNKAIAAGAQDTTQDNPEVAGFMHMRAFRDINAHLWECFAFIAELPPEALH